jgi:hypothetical protein
MEAIQIASGASLLFKQLFSRPTLNRR